MKTKAKRLFQNYYFISFILGALSYFMFLSYSQMAGGKYIVLDGDALEGTIPAIKLFFDNLLSGKSIAYTWTSFLGINAYVNLCGNMLFSITMPLYLLFFKFDYATITVIALTIKAGLSSLCFYIYMYKVWNIKGVRNLIFSVSYSMCAFWVVYIPVLLLFSDAIFLLPLILYFVSKYADDGKYKLMSFTYLYLFLNFYYSAYIVGFFSFFYLVLYMLIRNRYKLVTILKKIIIFGLIICFSAGVTGVVLYPMAYFLFSKYAEDATVLSEAMQVNILDVYNQLYIGQACGYFSEYPYIYCGLPTLLIFPLYFFNKKINYKEKMIFGILLFLMIVSCFVLPLYLFWHCMDAPDGVPYRYSFIISFILCVIACRESESIFEHKKITLLWLVIFNGLIYIICKFIQPLYQDDFYSYPVNTWLYFGINFGFMIFYFAWVCLYSKRNRDNSYNVGLKMMLVLVVIIELVLNGYAGYYKESYLRPKNNYDSYKLWENTVTEALNDIRDDSDDFYRISSTNDYIINSPVYFNYNGIASFSNIENYEVRQTLGNLGLSTSPRDLFCDGLTDFTRMILDVKYEINNIDFGSHRDYTVNYNQHATVIKNNNVLSLGFLVDSSIEQFIFDSRNQFKNINDLASCMTGKEEKLYESVTNGMDVNEAGITVVQDEDGLFRFVFTPEEGYNFGLLYLSIPLDEREAYVQFDYGVSAYDKAAPILCDGITGEINVYHTLSSSFILPLTRVEDAYEVAIYMMEGLYDNVYAPQNINFAYYNKDAFEETYELLKLGQLNIIEFDNDYVHGNIDVNEDGKVLFTSIPYDEGWEIKVNGVKKEPLKLLDGAFIGLELPKGSYDIEFRYHVPGLKTGCLITFISLLLMMGLFIINPQIKTEVRPERKHNKLKEAKGNNEELKEVNDPQEISNSK